MDNFKSISTQFRLQYIFGHLPLLEQISTYKKRRFDLTQSFRGVSPHSVPTSHFLLFRAWGETAHTAGAHTGVKPFNPRWVKGRRRDCGLAMTLSDPTSSPRSYFLRDPFSQQSQARNRVIRVGDFGDMSDLYDLMILWYDVGVVSPHTFPSTLLYNEETLQRGTWEPNSLFNPIYR